MDRIVGGHTEASYMQFSPQEDLNQANVVWTFNKKFQVTRLKDAKGWIWPTGFELKQVWSLISKHCLTKKCF